MYNIPEFVDTLKEYIAKKKPELIERKLHLSARLQSAQNFFSGDVSAADIPNAIDLLNNIISELNDVEKEMAVVDAAILAILESKLSNISFKINIDGYTDTLGNKVNSQEIYFVPWNTVESEKRVEITPEDLWFLRTAQRIFGADPSKVTLLERNKEIEIFSPR